jgi:DNA-binding MarR family transcriptional regulator
MELPASGDEITGILDDLRRIVRVLRESSRAAEGQLGVTGAQLFVLKALAEAPALSINALAERTRTHQSTVSVVVRRLVVRRLVKRTVSTSDGRRVELALTQRGRQLLARAPNAAQDRLIDAVARLAAPDRASLAGILHQLVEAMRMSDREPAMFFEDDESVPAREVKKRHG